MHAIDRHSHRGECFGKSETSTAPTSSGSEKTEVGGIRDWSGAGGRSEGHGGVGRISEEGFAVKGARELTSDALMEAWEQAMMPDSLPDDPSPETSFWPTAFCRGSDPKLPKRWFAPSGSSLARLVHEEHAKNMALHPKSICPSGTARFENTLRWRTRSITFKDPRKQQNEQRQQGNSRGPLGPRS